MSLSSSKKPTTSAVCRRFRSSTTTADSRMSNEDTSSASFTMSCPVKASPKHMLSSSGGSGYGSPGCQPSAASSSGESSTTSFQLPMWRNMRRVEVPSPTRAAAYLRIQSSQFVLENSDSISAYSSFAVQWSPQRLPRLVASRLTYVEKARDVSWWRIFPAHMAELSSLHHRHFISCHYCRTKAASQTYNKQESCDTTTFCSKQPHDSAAPNKRLTTTIILLRGTFSQFSYSFKVRLEQFIRQLAKNRLQGRYRTNSQQRQTLASSKAGFETVFQFFKVFVFIQPSAPQ